MADQSTPRDAADLVVVGAGPAGLAAAGAAAARGLAVVLVDGGTAPGGQYWRRPAPGSDLPRAELAAYHHDLGTYRELLEAVAGVDSRASHHVWSVERDGDVWAVHAVDRTGGGERPVTVRAPRLVLAPGAHDRQLPFPGWDLPGVMTAGGAQALLKGHGVAAGARAVVAGTGPFLLPVATGLAAAGTRVVEVVETSTPTRWLRHLPAVAGALPKLGEGAGYAAALARARVPVRGRSAVVEAHGTDQLEAVTVARVDADGRVRAGTGRRLEVDLLAVGWGFTPQLELPLQAGARTRTDLDGSLVCVVDDRQQAAPGLWVAGEACGVGGSALAVLEGRVAGAAAAGDGPDPADVRRRRRLRRFAGAMHAAHPLPAAWDTWLTDATTVCRCEEVTVGRLRDALSAGASDPRTAKHLARTGMGWCQGRVCGTATTCLLARWSGTEPDPSALAHRPVASPITLGTLVEATRDVVEPETQQRS